MMNKNIKRLKNYLEIIRAVTISGILGGNVASILLANHPKNAVSYIQYSLFGWRFVSKNGLPTIQLHDLFNTPDNISVEFLPKTGYLTYWDANYTKDLIYLALLTKILSPETIFEIGTFHGYSALLFAMNSLPAAKVYTLDLPSKDTQSLSLSTTLMDDYHIRVHSPSSYLYPSYSVSSKIKQLYGDSAKFDFNSFHDKVDLFFIDGSHSYDYVRSDSLNALPCVRKGGVIVWHDYGRFGVNGVTRWLHKLAKDGRNIFRLPGSSLAILKID